MADKVKGFCDSPIWHGTSDWNSTSPDFTPCFQNTVLVCLPLVYLILFLSIKLIKGSSFPQAPNPFGFLFIIKFNLNIILCLLLIFKAGLILYNNLHLKEIYLDNIFAPFIELITIVLSTYTLLNDRRHGILVSMILPPFWFIEILSYCAFIYSDIVKFEEKPQDIHFLVLKITFGSLALIQLILSNFPENEEPSLQEHEEDMCPYRATPFFSRLTFSWMLRIFKLGLKNDLTTDNLYSLCPELKSKNVTKAFERSSSSRKKSLLRNHSNSTDDDQVCILDNSYDKYKYPKKSSLLWKLVKVSGKYMGLSGILELFAVIFNFTGPILLECMLNFVSSDEIFWHGLIYAFAMFAGKMVSSFCMVHAGYCINVASVQLKSSLISAIYKKVFKISSFTKKEHTSGEIINLVSTDADEVLKLLEEVHLLWIIPLEITICICFLYINIGPSCFVGVGIIACILPVTAKIAKIMDKYQNCKMKNKDERLEIMSEILNGIKVLKLYAWELPFMNQILKIRDTEINFQKKTFYWDSTFNLLWTSAPYLMAASSFAVFTLSSEKNVMTPQKAFFAMSVFNVLRFPMGDIPDMIVRLIRCYVSMGRLRHFFESDELEPECVGTKPDEGYAITMQNATFSWEPQETPALKNIYLKIKEGSLVAVIGTVGSGKSSLLSSILAELYKLDGEVDVKGKIAYVSQQAWIQNCTLCQNILFTKEMKTAKYQQILDLCALKPDLELLPGGDLTEIGEKGVNLSGGQKQRVSLARAVYQNRDIYLLDDPLSAVDAHVASSLFQNVIGPTGLLKKKTRILATHNLSFLSEVDHIIILENGTISNQGTYKELLESGEQFMNFVQEPVIEEMEEKKKDFEEIKQPRITKQNKLFKEMSKLSGQEEIVGGFSDNDIARLIEEEKTAYGKISYKMYFEYFKNMGLWMFVAGVTTSAISCSCEMGAGIWLSKWSTSAANERTAQNSNFWVGIYFLIVIVKGFLEVITALIFYTGAIWASLKLHKKLLHRILRAPLSFFDGTPIGRILNRFSSDMESVDEEIPANLMFCISSMVWLPGVLVIISLVSVYFLLSVIPLALMYYGIQKCYIAASRQLRRLTSVTNSPVYSALSEALAGTSTIKAFKAEEFFIKRCQDRVDRNSNCYLLDKVTDRWVGMSLYSLSCFITLSVALFVVFGRGHLDAGIVGLALIYCLELSVGLHWMVRVTSQLEISIVSLERIREYSQVQEEDSWTKDYKPSSFWPEYGKISFENFTTTYRDGLEPVINGINLHIKSGEKIGIVGRTGAGKSSLLLSLFRIIEPTEGTITIDNIDVTQLGLHDLRSKLSIIPQDPIIFAGSLRMNLDPWDESSDQAIWTALEYAHMKDFVSSLDGTLHYELTEGGENFSVGQRQLICLARALLRKNKILVLDEATASVDVNTDQMIQDSIRGAFASCTVICIAHRLGTILDCDRVIVMSKGEIIEDGNPSVLINDSKSHFYSLARDAGLT